MEDFNILIGKHIVANGWQRDNGGTTSGVIDSVEVDWRGKVTVYVNNPECDWHMTYFTFTKDQIETLIEFGELPEANRLLNSGTNASIK